MKATIQLSADEVCDAVVAHMKKKGITVTRPDITLGGDNGATVHADVGHERKRAKPATKAHKEPAAV